jgi:5,5'-dehydrodivanillate O-demethylase oxygenase subunit
LTSIEERPFACGFKERVMVNFMDFYYTGPGTLAGNYMRRFWHPVYRAEDLKPGWAKPIRIMGEDFTLYRGEGGKPHVVGFRCPHRLTQLSVGWVEEDCIRCRFHGWKFDSSGQCVEQPAEKESFAEKVRIRSCPTDEYLGLVFAYFGEGSPPPLPRYPDFEKAGLWVETYVRPCNFVNNLENDPIHIPFTHRESEFYMTRAVEIPDITVEESEWGVLLQSRFPSGKLYITHHGLPNILCFRERDRDHLAWRVPIDDESHRSFQLDVTHILEGEEGEAYKRRHQARTGKLGRSPTEIGEAVLRGDVRIQDIEGDERANIVWIQDYATQVGQGPVELRKQEWLGRSDRALILIRKLWERELQALESGTPLKQWVRSERLAGMYSRANT